MPKTRKYENIESGFTTKDEMITMLNKKTGFTKKNIAVFLKALEEVYSELILDDKGFMLCRGIKMAPLVIAEKRIRTASLLGYDKLKNPPEYLDFPPMKSYRLVINEELKKSWNTPEEQAKFVRSTEQPPRSVGRPRKEKENKPARKIGRPRKEVELQEEENNE